MRHGLARGLSHSARENYATVAHRHHTRRPASLAQFTCVQPDARLRRESAARERRDIALPAPPPGKSPALTGGRIDGFENTDADL
jgi:hypothetical protein